MPAGYLKNVCPATEPDLLIKTSFKLISFNNGRPMTTGE